MRRFVPSPFTPYRTFKLASRCPFKIVSDSSSRVPTGMFYLPFYFFISRQKLFHAGNVFTFIHGEQRSRCAVGDASRGTFAVPRFSVVSVSAVGVAVNTRFCTTALFGSLTLRSFSNLRACSSLAPHVSADVRSLDSASQAAFAVAG